MTDRDKAKQIGRDIVEAAESYLIAFIRLARSSNDDGVLKDKRERLLAAIDAAIDAADGR